MAVNNPRIPSITRKRKVVSLAPSTIYLPKVKVLSPSPPVVKEPPTPCNICFEIPEDRGTLACNHSFCFDCIFTWSKETNQCPLCRARFQTISRKEKKLASQKTKGRPLEKDIVSIQHKNITFEENNVENFFILAEDFSEVMEEYMIGHDDEEDMDDDEYFSEPTAWTLLPPSQTILNPPHTNAFPTPVVRIPAMSMMNIVASVAEQGVMIQPALTLRPRPLLQAGAARSNWPLHSDV